MSIGKIKKLKEDDKAVSPVIGVILMVAITVILAAVVAAFVFGVVGQPTAAPQASLEIDTINNETLKLAHQGGDDINASDTEIKIEDDDGTYTNSSVGGGDWSDGTLSVGDKSGNIVAGITGGSLGSLGDDLNGVVTVTVIDTSSNKVIIELSERP